MSAIGRKVAAAKGMEVVNGWVRCVHDSKARGVLAREPMGQLVDHAELGAATVASVFDAHDLECRHAVEGLFVQLRLEGGRVEVLREILLDIHLRGRDPVSALRAGKEVREEDVRSAYTVPTHAELEAGMRACVSKGEPIEIEGEWGGSGGIGLIGRMGRMADLEGVAASLCVPAGTLVEFAVREFYSRLGHRWYAEHAEEAEAERFESAVAEFLAKRTTRADRTSRVGASELFEAFLESQGRTLSPGAWTQTAFGREMSRLGYQRVKTAKVWEYDGLCLVSKNAGEPEESKEAAVS